MKLNSQYMKSWIAKNVERSKLTTGAGKDGNFDYELKWVFALWDARSFGDLRWKDIAELLMEGIPPLTIEKIDEIIEEYCEDESAEESWNNMFLPMLKHHYGIND